MVEDINLEGWRVQLYLQEKDVPAGRMVVDGQHGSHIIRESDIREGRLAGDGVFLETRNTCAGVRTADCLPLAIVTADVGLLLHVSRKTLIADLLEAVPRLLPIEQISAVYLGPHICQKHFVFEWEGPELARFRERFPHAVRNDAGKLYLSLVEAVSSYLKRWNIPERIVRRDSRCTVETSEIPSYRRWRIGHPTEEGFPEMVTVLCRL